MHECIKKLLTNVENPEEDDMESLCRLMTTVGKQLEEDPLHNKGSANKQEAQDRARNLMEVYMERLRSITQSDKVSSRVHFMVLVSVPPLQLSSAPHSDFVSKQDVLDLRKVGWTGRQAPSGPKTIQQIHADVRRSLARTSFFSFLLHNPWL